VGFWPIFYLWSSIALQDTQLQQLLEPTVVGLGYELVGVERVRDRGDLIVRVYIDQPQGIRVEDCERVSRQISGLLDVEDPVRERYTLEVSSPGIDRPLFTPEHFSRYSGRQARIRLRQAVENQKNYIGVLQGCNENEVLIEIQDTVHRLPFALIEKARLTM